ncbi:MAG: hypothetical protein II262_00930 [Alistipes sp.]|jgi:hypothetical protein|nr:hypothetical protein [Alistipes sp.]
MFEYKYTIDNKTKYLTLVHFLIFIGVAIGLFVLFEGGYIMAWFVSIVVAIVALMALSIPRKVIVAEDGIDICCISDYTFIPYNEIASIRCVEKGELKFTIPIFAAVGFFGYYGNYLNLRSMDFVKIYASKWSGFIEITDIYEDKYYISCDNESELVSRVLERVSLKPEENE